MNHDPAAPAAEPIAFDDFLKVDIRCGTIRSAAPFPEARRPAYVVTVDFGPVIGTRKSIAQITERYTPEDLLGRHVMAVVNFPPRQIGRHRSEVLLLGFADRSGAIALATSAEDVPDGARLA